ncbi:YceD family protein [Hoeflea poritis]|uniref:DUF177 domain-containing protein n=1 Tax=Hoeflea poritis TaxID=2993659 RepID=A0ABT4VXQ4_9HYPH|nr:DUF177 domain-containing protein [Hoeflea poritis]MDA4848812.1 DUF177 domain-containing protein [Hoeflea poritis]
MAEKNTELFHYRVNVGHLSAKPVTVSLEADSKERLEMAERWGVSRIDDVSAVLELTRWKRDGVRVKGRVQASIEQSCVVTLEPVTTTIDEPVDALFVPEGSKLARIATDENGEIVFDAEGPDIPESFHGDTIDVGSVCEEFIVLAIDPYPRKEGAVLDSPDDRQQTEEKPSPFAGLERWKQH